MTELSWFKFGYSMQICTRFILYYECNKAMLFNLNSAKIHYMIPNNICSYMKYLERNI